MNKEQVLDTFFKRLKICYVFYGIGLAIVIGVILALLFTVLKHSIYILAVIVPAVVAWVSLILGTKFYLLHYLTKNLEIVDHKAFKKFKWLFFLARFPVFFQWREQLSNLSK